MPPRWWCWWPPYRRPTGRQRPPSSRPAPRSARLPRRALASSPHVRHPRSLNRALCCACTAPAETTARVGAAADWPQFHATPLNDYWFGEGFTDWELVCKAKGLRLSGGVGKLGLQQLMRPAPLGPDGFGYYNLMDREVRRRQASAQMRRQRSPINATSHCAESRPPAEEPTRHSTAEHRRVPTNATRASTAIP